MSKEFEKLRSEVNAGKLAPVYFLFGEENFYLDQLADLIEKKAMEGAEPSFNQDIVYGPDVSAAQLIAAARSFPIMAARRLVLVKEAHRIRKDEAERLVGYLDSPSPTTVLVLLHKDKKKPDQRTKYGKAINSAVVFESKPLYENQVPAWVESYLKERKTTIDPDALQVLVAALGTHLQRIVSELDKILLNLKDQPAPHIDRKRVFDAVEIDREFNIFELLNQVGARNVGQAHLILDNMLKNPKANPPVLMLAQLNGYLSKLAHLKHARIDSEQGIASELKIHPFLAKGYRAALQKYTYPQLVFALKCVFEADLALKGIQTTRMGEEHILKTLLFQILQAA